MNKLFKLYYKIKQKFCKHEFTHVQYPKVENGAIIDLVSDDLCWKCGITK